MTDPPRARKKRPRVSELLNLTVCHRGLLIYRVAEPGWRIGWNRSTRYYTRPYQELITGCGIVTGHWCWSFVWRRS